jgi:hypothetical protein
LTGCGEQKIGAHVNLGVFYVAGIPMAALLAFVAHLNGMVLKFFKSSLCILTMLQFFLFFLMTLLELRQLLHDGNASEMADY